MYQILPFVTAAGLALPNLPVELWASILRLLDPDSLLTAVRTSTLWNRICLGDPVLRRSVRERLMVDRERQHQEILNPGLLMTISRDQPTKLFGKSNGTKTVHRRPLTEIQNAPVGFIEKKPKKKAASVENKKMKTVTRTYRSIRC